MTTRAGITTTTRGDPRLHFHGYAIVRGGTAYAVAGGDATLFGGEVYDVVGVEIRRADGGVVGPFVGPGGLPRRRAATKVAAVDVVAILPTYPKPSHIHRILSERVATAAPTAREPAPITSSIVIAPRAAPALAAALLATTTFSPAPLWRLTRRRARPTARS